MSEIQKVLRYHVLIEIFFSSFLVHLAPYNDTYIRRNYLKHGHNQLQDTLSEGRARQVLSWAQSPHYEHLCALLPQNMFNR